MNFTDAYMKLAAKHSTNEEDTRRALVLTIDHLRAGRRGTKQFNKQEIIDGHDLLDEWLGSGTEFVRPNFTDEREIASAILNRCPAVTWATLIAYKRQDDATKKTP